MLLMLEPRITGPAQADPLTRSTLDKGLRDIRAAAHVSVLVAQRHQGAHPRRPEVVVDPENRVMGYDGRQPLDLVQHEHQRV